MPDPNNVVFHEHGIAWFGLCKNANTAIKRAFFDSMGMEPDRLHGPENLHYASKIEIAFSAIWSFAIVRDPYDRVASCWRDKMHDGWIPAGEKMGLWRGMAFADFLRVIAHMPDEDCRNWAQHWRSQTFDIADESGTLLPSFIGRYESLDAAWNTVRRKSRVPLPELRRENASARRPVQWTPDLRAIVRARYARDFDLLGYAV